MGNDSKSAGVPVLVYPFAAIITTGIIGTILDDMRVMWIVFIMFILVILAIMLQAVIGDKIKRKGKVLKRPEDGDIHVPVICTRYMLGCTPMKVESDGVILAKLWAGNKVSLPLMSGQLELSAYRNKHDKTTAIVNVDGGSEIFLWFDHGEIDPARIIQIKEGERLPEIKSQESYKRMRKVLTILAIPTIIAGIFFLLLSMNELRII